MHFIEVQRITISFFPSIVKHSIMIQVFFLSVFLQLEGVSFFSWKVRIKYWFYKSIFLSFAFIISFYKTNSKNSGKKIF